MKLWTIVIINKNEWYIKYIKNKLYHQITNSKLENSIEIIILDDINKLEKSISNFGEYINVITDEEISDNFIDVVYKKIKKTNKDCIGLSGVIYVSNKSNVFDNGSFPISMLNPMKNHIIVDNMNKYLTDKISDLDLSKIDIKDMIVFKENKMSFSIIITAYKSQDYIEECLDSIESQTYFKNNDNFEVLVGVDNYYDTLIKLNQIKNKYRNLHIYMMKENKGTYITTNTLIDLVKYENVIRFDSDDIMVTTLVEEVVKNKNGNDIVKLGYVEMMDNIIRNEIIVESGIIYFKKSIMDNIAGGYKPWLCAADTELIMRLKNKVKISDIDKKLFVRRIHDNSLTNRVDTGYDSLVRRDYTNKIKNDYNDNEIKIERVVNQINKINENLVYMITTYNRINFLKKTIDTWYQTCNKKYNWTLIVSDDGSNDGTLEYLYNLNLKNIKILIIKNNRRGIHHQTNSLIKLVLNLDFDFGFKSDDDLIFLNSGWDDKYIKASKISGFYHLLFYDKSWGNRRGEIIESTHKKNILENCVETTKIQGAFWTFNKKILMDVGFFDTSLFNLCGYGHVDYSLRCCRMGYNDINNPFDVMNSNELLMLNKDNYVSNNNFNHLWNTKNIIEQKKKNVILDRTYIPYNQMNFDIEGNPITNYDISFIIPIRGRDDQIKGLEYNINKYFENFSYEIIYVYQNDNKLFKRGQLCNIGFKESRGEIVIFQDIDIRHLRYISFKEILNNFKKPFVAFDKITQLHENELGKYEIKQTEERPFGWGACSIFYREQFMISGGFSNLIFGWGAEDTIMNERSNYYRYCQDLGHVWHEPMRFNVDIHNAKWYNNNKEMFYSDGNRDKYKDGYVQTLYNVEKIQNDNIQILNVDNITVPDNFEYMELYKTIKKEDI